MKNITDEASFASALAAPIPQELKCRLIERRDQLLQDTDGEYHLGDLAQFIVIEPPDSVAQIEAAAGHPVITDPAFEWVARYDDGIFEAVTILSDDGFGVVLLTTDTPDIDGTVVSLLRSEAELSNPHARDRA